MHATGTVDKNELEIPAREARKLPCANFVTVLLAGRRPGLGDGRREASSRNPWSALDAGHRGFRTPASGGHRDLGGEMSLAGAVSGNRKSDACDVGDSLTLLG